MNDGEINLDCLAKDIGKVGESLCALGELIRGTVDMESDNWEGIMRGLGCLVEVMGEYVVGLSERGHAIDHNLKPPRQPKDTVHSMQVPHVMARANPYSND